jgi:hypothetical protein
VSRWASAVSVTNIPTPITSSVQVIDCPPQGTTPSFVSFPKDSAARLEALN